MPSLSLSLALALASSSSRLLSSSAVAGIGFPASINIGRTNTSVWEGDGSYFIGHLTNVAVGQTRNFTKQGTFTNNNNLESYMSYGDGPIFGSASFVNGKHYRKGLSWYENQEWMGYNIGHSLLIGLCTQVSSNIFGTMFSGLGWVSCSVWADSSAGDGDAGAYIVATNPSTDYNNFPTTGWGTGVIVTAPPSGIPTQTNEFIVLQSGGGENPVNFSNGTIYSRYNPGYFGGYGAYSYLNFNTSQNRWEFSYDEEGNYALIAYNTTPNQTANYFPNQGNWFNYLGQPIPLIFAISAPPPGA